MHEATEGIAALVELVAKLTAHLAEFAAALIIALAVIEAMWRVVKVLLRRDQASDGYKEGLRLALGRWLAIALEFLLAADIVLTALAPTWEDIGKLDLLRKWGSGRPESPLSPSRASMSKPTWNV